MSPILLDQDAMMLTLVLLGKFAISGSFAIIYVVTAEVFPTAVRGVAIGVGALWARVGGILAPYIGQLVGQPRS